MRLRLPRYEAALPLSFHIYHLTKTALFAVYIDTNSALRVESRTTGTLPYTYCGIENLKFCVFMRNEAGGGWMDTQGFLLEFVLEDMDGRALALIIASRNIIVNRYIVKTLQRLTLTLFVNIKTA